jgi:putative transposase
MLRSTQENRRSVEFFCALFGKTRRAFYERKPSSPDDLKTRKTILRLIRNERITLPCSGGKKLYHKLKPLLVQRGIKCGRDKLFDILREENLLIKPKRSYHQTTDSNHRKKVYENLIKDEKFDRPNQVWVSDITYIRVGESFQYLNLTTDLVSRKIVGYSLWDTLETEGTLRALKQALNYKNPTEKLIHHSDRGVQYCSQHYTNLLKKNGIMISMAAKACPYENAVAERVNGILKVEFDLKRIFENKKIAKQSVYQAIRLYNKNRTHWGLGLRTPDEVHFQELKVAA